MRMSEATTTAKRLRWHCHRGTKELDVLLERFLDSGYPALGAEGRAAFERLLEQEDHRLQAWLLGEARPTDDGELLWIVERVRGDQLPPPG